MGKGKSAIFPKAQREYQQQLGGDATDLAVAAATQTADKRKKKRYRSGVKESFINEATGYPFDRRMQILLYEKKTLLKSPKKFFNKADIKPEFPEDPPPEITKRGYHPDLESGEKVAKRFNKLDPMSARAMPKTGNPHIDAKVAHAAKQPKDERETKRLRSPKEMRQGLTPA